MNQIYKTGDKVLYGGELYEFEKYHEFMTGICILRDKEVRDFDEYFPVRMERIKPNPLGKLPKEI